MGDSCEPGSRAEYISGTCPGMCPKSEMLLRERENLLHRFEVQSGTENDRRPRADPSKVVKCYRRSAAGHSTASSDLRSYPVLLRTIHYLFNEIFPIHRDKPVVVYDFMFDRLRAVRQDMVIQNLRPTDVINLLEPIARFHMYFGYVLVEESEMNFDSHINNSHLQECLKRLLVCYDLCDSDGDDLLQKMGEMKMNDVQLKNRYNFEGAYLLSNLPHVEALVRGSKMAGTFLDNELLNLSFAWYLKNYVRVLHSLKNLPPLLLCIASNCIPEIRKCSLQIMSCAYSCRNCTYPISHLKDLLLYESEAHLIDDCHELNVKITGNNVNFSKSNFNYSVKSLKNRRLSWVDQKLLGCDLVKLLCFGTE